MCYKKKEYLIKLITIVLLIIIDNNGITMLTCIIKVNIMSNGQL